jgi:hypothetical protein
MYILFVKPFLTSKSAGRGWFNCPGCWGKGLRLKREKVQWDLNGEVKTKLELKQKIGEGEGKQKERHGEHESCNPNFLEKKIIVVAVQVLK